MCLTCSACQQAVSNMCRCLTCNVFKMSSMEVELGEDGSRATCQQQVMYIDSDLSY